MPATTADAAMGAVRTRLRLECSNPARPLPGGRGAGGEPGCVAAFRTCMVRRLTGSAGGSGNFGILSSAKTGVAIRSGTTSVAAAAGISGSLEPSAADLG